jgi:hypothetical protein
MSADGPEKRAKCLGGIARLPVRMRQPEQCTAQGAPDESVLGRSQVRGRGKRGEQADKACLRAHFVASSLRRQGQPVRLG